MADKLGVSGLTEDHWRRISLGLASYQDVARELGVTRQTVHKAFASRGWTKEAWAQRQQAEDAKRQRQQQGSASRHQVGDDAEEDRGLLPEGQRDQLLRQVGLGIVKAGTTLIAEVNAGIDRERGSMTPTVINGYLRALERLNGALVPWLTPPPSAQEEPIAELRVSVMTDEEVAEMKGRKVDLGEDDGVDDVPDSHSSGVAAVPATTDRPPSPEAQAPKLPSVTIHDPLPDRSGFEEWLHHLAKQRGRRHLRDIASALGLPVAAGQDTELIVAMIQHEVGGDPERLREVARIIE